MLLQSWYLLHKDECCRKRNCYIVEEKGLLVGLYSHILSDQREGLMRVMKTSPRLQSCKQGAAQYVGKLSKVLLLRLDLKYFHRRISQRHQKPCIYEWSRWLCCLHLPVFIDFSDYSLQGREIELIHQYFWICTFLIQCPSIHKFQCLTKANLNTIFSHLDTT